MTFPGLSEASSVGLPSGPDACPTGYSRPEPDLSANLLMTVENTSIVDAGRSLTQGRTIVRGDGFSLFQEARRLLGWAKFREYIDDQRPAFGVWVGAIDFTGLNEAEVHVNFVLQETEVFCVPRQVVEDAQPDLACLLGLCNACGRNLEHSNCD